MKKLLLILLCLPMIGFGQSCNYASLAKDAEEICSHINALSFSSDKNADVALNNILSVSGIEKKFAMIPCVGANGCFALIYNKVRYIVYDPNFMREISENTGSSWSNMTILAHEIGHHVNSHTLYSSKSLEENRKWELEADEFAGFILHKLGASLDEAQSAVRLLSNNDDEYSTHPSRDKRLMAIEQGFRKSIKGVEIIPEFDNIKSAEDYFYKGKLLNKEKKYDLAIKSLSLCISLDPHFYEAYIKRGVGYTKNGLIDDALKDFNLAINMQPNNYKGYWGLGTVLLMAENEESDNKALNILNKAASLYQQEGQVYHMLGWAEMETGLEYCESFKKACDLGVCSAYKYYCE
tara:strand:+ start:1053 stop:2105 length:1053 start_codon:yes stop_codon:yes gene_type:complete